MIVEDCHFNLLDDWGSFESEPELRSEHRVAVGLYPADNLSDGHIPVGMGNKKELTETFLDLTEKIKVATKKLWAEMAGWTRDQQLDAGALTYYGVGKEFAHYAGVYEMEDWMFKLTVFNVTDQDNWDTNNSGYGNGSLVSRMPLHAEITARKRW